MFAYTTTVGALSNGIRDMDCIIDPVGGKGGLWVGSYVGATNTQQLLNHGIRSVVTAEAEQPVNYDKQVIPYHLKIPALDYETFSLDPYFEQAADFIESNLHVTNVLVHCMAGVSRSVSFTIGYLMKYRGMQFEDALNLVRSRRPIANPNAGFIQQLKRYRKYLKSHGKIHRPDGRHLSPSPQPRSKSRSRSRSPNPADYIARGGVYGSAVTPMSPVGPPPQLVQRPNQYLMPPVGSGGMYGPPPVAQEFYSPLYASDVRQGGYTGYPPPQSWNPTYTGYWPY